MTMRGWKGQGQRVVHDELRQLYMTNCGNPDRNWVIYCTGHVDRIAATTNGQPPDAVMIPRRRAYVCTGCRPSHLRKNRARTRSLKLFPARPSLK
jgi:hypothetical protein